MADEALADRSSRVLLALATVGATIVLGCLALALARTPPARDVAFVGGWDDDNARCRDQSAWNGKVAWTTCDWFYRDRALVELDPEDARATEASGPSAWSVNPEAGWGPTPARSATTAWWSASRTGRFASPDSDGVLMRWWSKRSLSPASA
jgi:hypothetical protein